MADLKKLGDEIRTLLRQLNGRQKATLIAFGAVILVPLLWLSVRSSDEAWLAVQDGNPFEPETLRQAEEALRKSGFNDLRVDGERLFVLSEKLALADAALNAADILNPEDTGEDESAPSPFDIFKTPGTAERESQQRLHKDIERALSAVTGIDAATVISSRSKPARWNQKPEVAAAVYVTPTPGSRFTSELRNSIFASVARMIPDLVPQKIVVIDQKTGRSWTSDSNTRFTDIREEFEDRIAAALNWIPEAEVRVLSVKGTQQATLTHPPEPNSLTVKSVPNQPGTVLAADRGTVEVEVLIPSASVTSHAGSTTRSKALSAKKERIVKDVKRVLPAEFAATVSVSEQVDPLTLGTAETERVAGGSLVLPSLLLASAVVIAVWWYRGSRLPDPMTDDLSVTQLPLESNAIATQPVIDEFTSEVAATGNEPLPERTPGLAVPDPVPANASQPRFEYLQQTKPLTVYRLLAGEHPQTMALVLRHLPTKHATDVVSLLPSGIQSEVIRRIAEADLSDRDVLDELEQSLQTRLTSRPASAKAEATAAPQKATALTPLARFEEIVELSPENLKCVTEEVEESLWADALRGSSETLRFRIIASLPPQQARSVRASLNATAQAGTDVETTRNRIVETVNSLSLPDNSRPLRHEFVA